MARIEAKPGEPLTEVCVYLKAGEARDLLDALKNWAEERGELPRPGFEWQAYFRFDPGPELTISVAD